MTEHAARRQTLPGAVTGLLKSAVFRLRVSAARFVYDRILQSLVTDVEWCCRFYPFLDSDFAKQVLIVGPHSFALALSCAPHHPEVHFVAIELQGSRRYTRSAKRKRLNNVNFIEVPAGKPLPFTHKAFNTIICNFALHPLMPANKIALLRGLAPLLSAGGRLHLVELDRPASVREGKMLGFAALLWGTEAVAPHLDDSWRNCFPQAGLRALAHERSFSIVAGRVSVIVVGHKRDGAKPMRKHKNKD